MTTSTTTKMVATNVDWADRAACANHPILDRNAWLRVTDGHPRNEGLEAVIVCRTVCPVRVECRQWYQGRDVVASGGWHRSDGTFRGADPDLFDAHLAAAYIGVAANTIIAWRNSKKLRSVKVEGGRNWYHIDDVKRLAKRHGPPHGTQYALRLHVIRGEDPCWRCSKQRSDEVPVA